MYQQICSPSQRFTAQSRKSELRVSQIQLHIIYISLHLPCNFYFHLPTLTLFLKLMFTFNKDVMCLIQNKDLHKNSCSEQRFVRRLIQRLSSHSFLQADDSYTESELDLTQRRRFILGEEDWYSTKKPFPPILNLCSKHRAEDLF